MVGCSAGEGHLVRDESTGSIEWTAHALSESLLPVARAMRTSMIVMKDFPRATARPCGRCAAPAMRACPACPAPARSQFQDLRGIPADQAQHKTRKNLRSKYRKAAASGPETKMEVIRDVEPHIEELYPLYRQVVERSATSSRRLTKSYFVQMSRRLGDRALFFIWRQGGKAVAFSSCAGTTACCAITTSASTTRCARESPLLRHLSRHRHLVARQRLPHLLQRTPQLRAQVPPAPRPRPTRPLRPHRVGLRQPALPRHRPLPRADPLRPHHPQVRQRPRALVAADWPQKITKDTKGEGQAFLFSLFCDLCVLSWPMIP